MRIFQAGILMILCSLWITGCSKKDNPPQEQPPVVISKWTEHAKGGDQLVINGSGFSDVKSENLVTINDKICEIVNASTTELTVIVPARAGEGKISVKVNNITGVSASEFHYDWVSLVSTPEYIVPDGIGYGSPIDIVVDAAGNIYTISSSSIFKIGSDNEVTNFAGGGFLRGYQNGPGNSALFHNPSKLAIDANGNIYVADAGNHAIRKITPLGIVSTIAGNGTSGYEDGNISEARFRFPAGITVDNAGNIYVTETTRVRKISGNSVTTFAGNSNGGDIDGMGTFAYFWGIQGICTGADGNFFLAEQNHKIRKITPAGAVTSLAGNKTNGFQDGFGEEAKFYYPHAVAGDKEGNIIVADKENHSIRMVSKTGRVTTLAGIPETGYVDGTGAEARFNAIYGVTVAPNGQIYVADAVNHVIRKITLQ